MRDWFVYVSNNFPSDISVVARSVNFLLMFGSEIVQGNGPEVGNALLSGGSNTTRPYLVMQPVHIQTKILDELLRRISSLQLHSAFYYTQ